MKIIANFSLKAQNKTVTEETLFCFRANLVRMCGTRILLFFKLIWDENYRQFELEISQQNCHRRDAVTAKLNWSTAENTSCGVWKSQRFLFQFWLFYSDIPKTHNFFSPKILDGDDGNIIVTLLMIMVTISHLWFSGPPNVFEKEHFCQKFLVHF